MICLVKEVIMNGNFFLFFMKLVNNILINIDKSFLLILSNARREPFTFLVILVTNFRMKSSSIFINLSLVLIASAKVAVINRRAVRTAIIDVAPKIFPNKSGDVCIIGISIIFWVQRQRCICSSLGSDSSDGITTEKLCTLLTDAFHSGQLDHEAIEKDV